MFDLFHIDFVTFTLLDLFDIAVVTFILYQIYRYLRGTIASQIFVGLVIIFFISFLVQAIQLRALDWLLNLLTQFWIIAFIIIFQPEIRRLLVMVATNPLFKFVSKKEDPDIIKEIVDASFILAQSQYGALIVIVKSSGIRGFIETGLLLEAKATRDLIVSIFFPRAPLHDGAIVIRDNIVEAARVTLPLSSSTHLNGESLGMRHRAGLGISEQADVLSIIISEERGSISVASQGKLTRGLSREQLRKALLDVYSPKRTTPKSMILREFFKKS